MQQIKRNQEIYYKTRNVNLIHGDSFKVLQNIKEKSIDMIFADPPYFLSNGGISVHAGKQVKVNKGKWDEGYTDFYKKHEFNREWIRLCSNVLKDDGTIWISGTMHNIYSVGVALEEEGFKILNNITWKKLNPPPNLACRCFTHSTETILWAKKDIKKAKHTYNYETMKKLNGNKQMKDVWEGPLLPKAEKKFGKHPTQKPEYILEKIILASTKKGDVILDPFTGSSTTGVVAKKLGRKFIGIDNSKKYLNLSIKRLEDI